MKTSRFVSTISAFCLVAAGSVLADGGVTFTDIAAGGGAGITYQRTPAPRVAQLAAIRAQSPIINSQFFNVVRPSQFPQKPTGSTGTVIFDYDNDGDLDIYVTNGPGTDNSLYSSQLVESGVLAFVDVGGAAGVGATSQESSGACAGDVDNDGDTDLYVVSTGMSNVMFENQGDGTFVDITASSGTAGNNRHAVACSMADFNHDGRLDIVVANTYDDWTHNLTVFSTNGLNYPGLEHNNLFMNQGANVFTDESAARGIETVAGANIPGMSGASFTWAIASLDYDLDGDVDIFYNDTQGSMSVGIGYPRPFVNDGTGQFTDRTVASNLTVPGSWMGTDFGDFNCDGLVDFFSTDLGYLGNGPSRWFLQNPDGTFSHNNAGNLRMTPFGWGASVFDYDNDGDSDIIYHGGMDVLQFIMYDNPGVILQNQGNCSADFAWDSSAILAEHRTRSVQGVAVGDLNGDGFEDIVSVSDSDTLVPGRFLLLARNLTGPTGSPFDTFSLLDLLWIGGPNPGRQTYDPLTPFQLGPGTVAVEVSSANNGNNWAQITAKGSAGVLANGTVPRDGIGGVVFFTPDGGSTSIRPVIGGASYGSQDALAANFGLGAATTGTAEVLWPGAIRNKLYNVAAGEKLNFPHIPCSYDGTWSTFGQYNSCVIHALNTYKQQGVIDAKLRKRLHESAQQAYWEAHP